MKKQRRDWYIKNKERQDARNRENYHMNKEKRLKQTAAYEKAHPEQRKRSARKYGLKRVGFTLELFEQRLQEQNYLCGICGIKLTIGKIEATSACADHNHTTNKPRGILCRHCNIGIGLLSENVETLASAIGYLERWK